VASRNKNLPCTVRIHAREVVSLRKKELQYDLYDGKVKNKKLLHLH
jgi:hypothetical protein